MHPRFTQGTNTFTSVCDSLTNQESIYCCETLALLYFFIDGVELEHHSNILELCIFLIESLSSNDEYSILILL